MQLQYQSTPHSLKMDQPLHVTLPINQAPIHMQVRCIKPAPNQVCPCDILQLLLVHLKTSSPMEILHHTCRSKPHNSILPCPFSIGNIQMHVQFVQKIQQIYTTQHISQLSVDNQPPNNSTLIHSFIHHQQPQNPGKTRFLFNRPHSDSINSLPWLIQLSISEQSPIGQSQATIWNHIASKSNTLTFHDISTRYNTHRY